MVSIIIASFNKGKYISETIESVLNQSYRDLELVIIDDGSTDDTLMIIKSYLENDKRIRLHECKENRGANYCRNIGLKISRGNYIIFLDADDILTRNCVENRVEIISGEVYNFCVFTMGVFISKIGDSDYVWRPDSKKPLIDFLQHKLPWSILQPIWEKDFLVKLNGFDESFNRFQDVELHTRCLLVENVKYNQVIAEPDCYYRIDEKRKNFDDFMFMNRRIEASLQYYFKFYPLISNKGKYLSGTIYSTYTQLLYHYKKKLITKEQLEILEKKLLNKNLNFNSMKNALLKLSKYINSLPFRIPGLNFLIYRFILFC